MKISITCEKPGWILYKLAEELKNRLAAHEVLINEAAQDAEINYFINYGYYRKKSEAIDVGFFTHYDPDLLADVWLRTAREMDHCVAQSESTRRTLLQQGIPDEKISVIMPGADEGFCPKVRLGISGKIQPGGRKGEHLLQKLMRDPEIGNMISIVANHEGWGIPVNRLNHVDYYQSIDFLLITSLIEGGPVPFLEALACGKLAIAPPIGYVPSFDHIEYKTGDYDDLKRVILETCRPIYEQRRRLSLQGKQYDWQYWADEHEKLFLKLHAQRKERGAARREQAETLDSRANERAPSIASRIAEIFAGWKRR